LSWSETRGAGWILRWPFPFSHLDSLVYELHSSLGKVYKTTAAVAAAAAAAAAATFLYVVTEGSPILGFSHRPY
jgi:hypothetical protein